MHAQDRLVLLDTFAGEGAASWARSVLQAEGIPAAVDAPTLQYGPNPAHRALVFVPEDLASSARTVLAEAQVGSEEDPEDFLERRRFVHRRRVRFLRLAMLFEALWLAIWGVVSGSTGEGVLSFAFLAAAATWGGLFLWSFFGPGSAFLLAAFLSAAWILLATISYAMDPGGSIEPLEYLRWLNFIAFMYWGWQASAELSPETASPAMPA